MPIRELLSEDKQRIDKYLDRYLPKKGKLAKAMRYSLFAGGKRFRPILCLAAARALGKDPRKALPIACAIEMLHTFTLIHDDLPAMDNSNYRRGKPACHKKFDEATAILAGDALNTLAFDVLAKEIRDPNVIREISEALLKVVDGQVLDMESQGKKISFSQLKSIHQLKTAALLIASLRAPAIHLKAGPKKIAALSAYAGHLGLAFQIADDILDATSTRKALGKPARADAGKGFPHFLGLERSRTAARREKEKAIGALKILGKRGNDLKYLAEFVIERKY